MMLAQRLYEAGYITYMRTDSTNLSQDAIQMARDYIHEEYLVQNICLKSRMFIQVKRTHKKHTKLFVLLISM